MFFGGLRTKSISKQSQEKQPLITVVTVVRNGEKTLEETILSVINQTYSNIEYIIVDGASTDGTLDIIKKYEDNKIDYWISESDKGIYDAMNKGIDLATGEWINFMNVGDVFCDNKVLEEIVNIYFLSNNKKLFFYSDYFLKNGLSNLDKIFFIADYEKGNILHQSVIYKKCLHKYYGYYIVTDKIIVSDYIFFNSINKNLLQKINIPISINNTYGISTGSWCYKQKLCVDYIFGRITFLCMVKKVCLFYIKHLCEIFLGKKNTILIIRIKKNIFKENLGISM
jgi:glycosyltransferase involved in cell wall biosynthesis